jgi:outer membrane protein assembly factor BamB
MVVQMGGKDVLLTQFSSDVVALNPMNGEQLWSHPHKTDYGLNITPPLWGADHLHRCQDGALPLAG